MSEKQLKKIEKLFNELETIDLQDLMEQSMYDPDPDKRKVYEALYTYYLDKKQDDLIKRQDFVI